MIARSLNSPLYSFIGWKLPALIWQVNLNPFGMKIAMWKIV